jgi:hypothetical protein
VRITLPDGTSASSETSAADRMLSAHFHRDVTLARAAPADFTIDMYHPDIEGAVPAARRGTTVEQKLGSAYFAKAGIPSPVATGAFFDLFPFSVVTTATLDRLHQHAPASRFDPRRFRMNAIVDTRLEGFPENEWLGRTLAIGDAVRIEVKVPDSRCVMTTLAQDDLPNDPEVLRTAALHNRIPVGASGPQPCVGVYAVVAAPGIARGGDRVTLV